MKYNFKFNYLSIIAFLAVLFYTNYCFSQTSSTALKDSIKANKYFDRIKNNITSHPDSVYFYALKAKVIGEKNNDYHIISQAHNFLGIYFNKKGNFEKAINNYENAILTAEKVKDYNLKAHGLSNLATLYLQQSFNDKAMYNYNLALIEFEKNNDETNISTTLENIGTILHEQDRLEEAFEYYIRALKIKAKQQDKRIGQTYSNISRYYNDKKQKDSSYYYMFKAIESFKEENSISPLASSYSNLAFIYETNQNPKLALKYSFKAIELFNQIGAEVYTIKPYCQIANIHNNAIQNNSKAEFYYKKAKKIAEKENLIGDLPEIYMGLAELYSKQKKYKISNDFLFKRIHIKDSLFTIKRDQTIAEIQIKYETEKIEKEILQQQSELTRNETTIKQQKNQIVFTLIIIFSLFLFLLYYNSQKKKTNRLYKQLVKQNIARIEDEKNKKQKTDIQQTKKYKKLADKISFLFDEEKIFKNNKLSSSIIAKLLKTNTTYISKAINEEFEMNFNSFLNTYRINEAVRLLANKEYNKYTLQTIAEEVGFNSNSVFISNFKKQIGVTPSIFIKNIEILDSQKKNNKSTKNTL